MGLGHNTTIVRNGLVFYYDASNTEKSWRGRPTTNNASNGRVDYYSRWATTTTFPALPFSKKTDVYVLTLGNNYLGGSGDFNITNGNTYTISYWYYIDTVQTMYHYMLPLNGSYATVATTSASTFVNTNNTRNVSGNINGWVWGYQTFTVNAVPTYMRGTYTDASGFSDNDPTGKMYITNVMIESGSVPSGPYGYTGGTRSNTQAIFDLTNNSTITADSLTYNADGTFSFDGTNNYCTTNNIFAGMNNNPTGWTISAWIKLSATVGITGAGDPLSGACIIGNDDALGIGLQIVNGNKVNYGLRSYGNFDSVATLSNNVWYNVAGVLAIGGGGSIYVNGAFDSSNVYPTNSIASSAVMKIGWCPNRVTTKFPGQISNVSMYNRALTANEIAQNFAALRDRYGI